MRHGNVPSRLYSALCVVTTLRLVDPPKASSQWISYVERENIPRYIHTKWGAQIVDPHGNIQHLIADGGLHYLPAVTDDSHIACDDSSTQRRPKGLGTFHSYRTSAPGRSLLSPTNSRLGTCDDDGFTQVLRGPKPQQQVAPRAYTQQSRFLPLSDSTDVPAAADTTVDVDDTPMPTSYAVQTRRMAQKAEDSLPTKLTESHKTAPAKPTPADDLLEHRRQGHAKSHPDCLDCPMGKLQARRTPFTRSTDSRSPTPAGFRLAGDLKGPLRPDINGNMWHLVLVDMDSKKGYLHSLPRKLSAGIKQGVLQFWADLKKTTGSDIGIAQFHSDDGKEFMGELDELLLSMGVNRTHTGGYAAKYNVIVEQRIKTLLGRMRANLHMAMGD